jgi:hypothetical protein
MDRIESGNKTRIKVHGIGLHKCERIVRLSRDIDAYDLEASPAVSKACAPRATEKIKQTWFHFMEAVGCRMHGPAHN